MSGVWVFGYGSLMWRPAFPFVEQRPAIVHGFSRRLEQGSPDHRGTPERLGRVATLVPDPGARCVGLCFALPPDEAEAILAQLDEREQGGYDRAEVEAFPLANPDAPLRAITWIARPGNPWHLGPAPLEAMAAQIVEAQGPSGTNVEYLLRLCETLRARNIDDDHVFALAHAVEAALPR